jgi:hypothetical protein
MNDLVVEIEEEEEEPFGYVDRALEAGVDAIDKIPSRHLRGGIRGFLTGSDVIGAGVDIYNEIKEREIEEYSLGLKLTEGQRMDDKEDQFGTDFVLPTDDNAVHMNYSDITFWGAYGAGLAGPFMAFAATGEPEWLTPYTTGSLGAANYLEDNKDEISEYIRNKFQFPTNESR